MTTSPMVLSKLQSTDTTHPYNINNAFLIGLFLHFSVTESTAHSPWHAVIASPLLRASCFLSTTAPFSVATLAVLLC